MDLKELMGDAYKEDMTKEEAQEFFKKQLLATGEYTNAGKAKAEQQESEKKLKDQIASLQAELEAKMTDDDKKKKADDDTRKLIEDLQKQLADSKASQSKMSAVSLLAEAKIKAGIKDGDKEFDNFINEISFEDSEKTSNIGKYISKIVANAYESGKSEAVKNKLGKMGSFKEGQDSDNSGDEKGSFGKQLAQSTKVEVKGEKNFFERK